MSVASLPSPGHKRRFDEAETLPDSFDRRAPAAAAGKRSKLGHGLCLPGRCVPLTPDSSAYASALAGLRGLYPGMDEQTLSDVLVDCGGNIDAAIRRLGGLSLAADASDPAADAQPDTPGDAPSPSQPVGPRLHEPAEQGPPGPSSDDGPQTAEQWVDYLVHELAQASDMPAAKAKAAVVLQRFEAFVARLVKQQAAQGEARAAKLAEENALLKRAVQIQHRQLQERSAQADELPQLRTLLAQYQEQVRQLEVNNYSLALHLQKATAGGFAPDAPRNPDVF